MRRQSLLQAGFCPIGAWKAETSSRKALLLRVGMDHGTGGALGPIFPDGTFEYVPIPEAVPTRSQLTYATLPGRHVRSLATMLPARLAERHPHLDPNFITATYGDAAPRKRRQLLRLAAGDLLLFYAGLAPHPPDDRPRLFAIGTLLVRRVHRLRASDLGNRDLRERFGRTAHFLRRVKDEELALVEGERKGSGLFARALPLGDGRNCLLRDLASWGYQGSLLRAVGHWIGGLRSLRSLEAWVRYGPESLVGRETQLYSVVASAIRATPEGIDLVVEHQGAREGDWIIALAEQNAGVYAFGRINGIAPDDEGGRVSSSLFWFFPDGGPALRNPLLPSLAMHQAVTDGATVRRLVSWFGRHYRIGLHRVPATEGTSVCRREGEAAHHRRFGDGETRRVKIRPSGRRRAD